MEFCKGIRDYEIEREMRIPKESPTRQIENVAGSV
jgi:hypothetical protein